MYNKRRLEDTSNGHGLQANGLENAAEIGFFTRGIYLFENIDMEGLSQERVYEFLFTWAPLKLVGATGSPGNPMVAW